MKAFILSVGDELVLGQTVDTNSAWISQQLAAIGCDIVGHATVGDDQPAIEKALRSAIAEADVVISSGGIGPTADDLSRQALAAVMGVSLEMHPEWMQHLEAFFAKLGRKMAETNRIQAMIPRGAEMLWNHAGTAAGIKARLGETTVFCVPGVPREMKAMFTRDVLPFVTEKAGGAAIVQCTLHTFGLGESNVAERLGELMKRGRNPSVGTTVANGMVSLRINSRFESVEKARAMCDETIDQCRQALGLLIYGEDGLTLPEAVGRLLNDFAVARQGGPVVATAESCTGGLLAKFFTDQPGSSTYFRQGWVTYTNDSKMSQLGVSEKTLQQYGAVSEPVVREMAIGAQKNSGAHFALSISGIAGPEGGSEAKPVGTVCIGFAAGDQVTARTFVFTGDRAAIRDRSAKMALTLLRFHLLGEPVPF
ncbi:MAG: competence/damage-inducible protein A [Tepidisphaeraceae bacterium]